MLLLLPHHRWRRDCIHGWRRRRLSHILLHKWLRWCRSKGARCRHIRERRSYSSRCNRCSRRALGHVWIGNVWRIVPSTCGGSCSVRHCWAGCARTSAFGRWRGRRCCSAHRWRTVLSIISIRLGWLGNRGTRRHILPVVSILLCRLRYSRYCGYRGWGWGRCRSRLVCIWCHGSILLAVAMLLKRSWLRGVACLLEGSSCGSCGGRWLSSRSRGCNWELGSFQLTTVSTSNINSLANIRQAIGGRLSVIAWSKFEVSACNIQLSLGSHQLCIFTVFIIQTGQLIRLLMLSAETRVHKFDCFPKHRNLLDEVLQADSI